MKEFLSTVDLDNIKNHEYKSTGYSKLDNIMKPYWVWVASHIPYVSIN
jgi:hypothetical protein